MKILISLFALILTTESCSSAKVDSSDSKPAKAVSNGAQTELTLKGGNAVKNLNQMSVSYKALSRGTFIYIEISEAAVLVSSDRNLINKEKYSCNKTDWDVINDLLDKVNRETFTELEAPTEKRFFDGAAHATLTIKKDGEEITTPSFDHGTPPPTIEALVNKVLSIKENAIKQ